MKKTYLVSYRLDARAKATQKKMMSEICGELGCPLLTYSELAQLFWRHVENDKSRAKCIKCLLGTLGREFDKIKTVDK